MYIVCDIGGTRMRVAGSKDLKTFSDPVIEESECSFEEGVKRLNALIDQASQGEKIKAVVAGAAGVYDDDHSMLLRAPNLPGWENKPLKAELEKHTGGTVYLENDTAIVGLGEAVFGAGKGENIVVYITISTGVGGVRIENGRVDSSAFGFEPGHHIVDIEKLTTFEDLVSGTALERRYGQKAETIEDVDVWDQVARDAAVGIHNTIVHWSPDTVVLGGGVMNNLSVDLIEKHLKDIMKIFPSLPKIKKAELKDVGGLYGGMAYLKNRI